MLRRPTTLAEIPRSVPVFPLSGALLLPFSQRPLNIFEPRYVEMISDAMSGDRMIGMIQPASEQDERPVLLTVGCAGRITA